MEWNGGPMAGCLGYEDRMGYGCLMLVPLGKTKGLGVSILGSYLFSSS